MISYLNSELKDFFNYIINEISEERNYAYNIISHRICIVERIQLLCINL